MIHPSYGLAYGLQTFAVLLAASCAAVPAVDSPPKTGTVQLNRFDQFGDPLPEGASARMVPISLAYSNGTPPPGRSSGSAKTVLDRWAYHSTTVAH